LDNWGEQANALIDREADVLSAIRTFQTNSRNFRIADKPDITQRKAGSRY
jgi:hypothetical protein